MSLTDNEVKVVSLIEQRFWETGSIPTNEKLSEDLRIAIPTIQKYWKNGDFRQALMARGVNLAEDNDKGILTPPQVLLANVLMNTEDTRSVREKLKTLNISTVQYNGWLRQPAFSAYLRKRAETAFSASDHVAYQALINAVESEDVQALKLYFEMRQIYNPRVSVDVNVTVIMARIVEIVARHVTDENTLMAIAHDVEMLSETITPTPVANQQEAFSIG